MASREQTEALGAVLNAGWLDWYDNKKHLRLAQVLVSGDLIWEVGMEKLVDDKLMTNLIDSAQEAEHVDKE